LASCWKHFVTVHRLTLGLDRLVMILAGDDNIRDIVAFPKTQKASDLLSGAPAPVDEHQLKDLNIEVTALEE
jgi:aspartyl-tRNA synthetase